MAVSAGPANFLNRGAIVQSLWVEGQNIVLNFSTDDEYKKYNDFYFGATIGRVANRIENGMINNLDGTSHTLAQNSGQHALHGGIKGWDKKVWTGSATSLENGKHKVVFAHQSSDGEEGYPGTVDATVTYTTYTENHDGAKVTVLEMEHEARLTEAVNEEDIKESVVNMTNHSYFNIGSSETIDGMMFKLSTNDCLEADADGIPTGMIKSHESVLSEVSSVLHEGMRVDSCFVLDVNPGTIPLDTRQGPLRTAATFSHSSTQLHLEIQTTEPAFQFYTGDFVNVPSIGFNPPRPNRAGFCIEPCRYVNAVNNPKWRNMVLLPKGKIYGSRTVYRAWKRPLQ